MNRFFTLLLAASCLTADGQVTYPYNPDGNADALIGATDLQDLLTSYGGAFSPSEIQVDGVGLSEVLTQLLTTQSQSLNWPLGYHGRPIIHHYDQGLFTVPSDSVLMITRVLDNGNNVIYHDDNLGYPYLMGNVSPSTTTPFPVGPGDSVELGGGSAWISGILVPTYNNVELAFWDFSNGPFVVPNSKMFFAVWGDDGFGGGQIEGFIDGDIASTGSQARFLFPAGTEFMDGTGIGAIFGYLLDTDHFKSTNSTNGGSDNETSISIDYVSDTVLVGAFVNEITITQPLTPSAWLATHVSYVNGVPTSISQTCQNEEEVLLHLSEGEFLGSARPIYGTMTLDLTQVESSHIKVRFNQLFDYTAWENLASQIDNLQMPYFDWYWRLEADYPQVSAKDSFYSSLGEFDQSHREWFQYGYPNQPPSSIPSPAYYGEWELIRLESGEWVPADNY